MPVEANPNETTRVRSRGVKRGLGVPNLTGIANHVMGQGKMVEQVVKTTLRTVDQDVAEIEAAPDYSTHKWWVWKDDVSHSWLGDYMGKPNEPTLREHHGAGAYVMCPLDDDGNPIRGQEIKIRIGGQIGGREGPQMQQSPNPNGSVTQPAPNVVMVQPAQASPAPVTPANSDTILQMMLAQQANQEERRAREDAQAQERARVEAAERRAELQAIREEQARREETRRQEEQRQEAERLRFETQLEQARREEALRLRELESKKEERLQQDLARQRELETQRMEQFRLELQEQRRETERREAERRAEQERLAQEWRKDEARREEDRRRDEQRKFELMQIAEQRRLEEDARRRDEEARRREDGQKFWLGLIAAGMPVIQKALEPKPDPMTPMMAKLAEDQARRDADLAQERMRQEARAAEERHRKELEEMRLREEARKREDEAQQRELDRLERQAEEAAAREERFARMMAQLNRPPQQPIQAMQPQTNAVKEALDMLRQGIELGEKMAGKKGDDKPADSGGFPFAEAFSALPAVMQALKPDAAAAAAQQAQAHAMQVEAQRQAAMSGQQVQQSAGYSSDEVQAHAERAVATVATDDAAFAALAAQNPVGVGKMLNKFLRNNPDYARSVVPKDVVQDPALPQPQEHEPQPVVTATSPAAAPEPDDEVVPDEGLPESGEGGTDAETPEPDDVVVEDDEVDEVEDDSDEVEEDDPEAEEAIEELARETGLTREQILSMSEEDLERAIEAAQPDLEESGTVDTPAETPTVETKETP